ncbi:MAG: hypothetical protein Q9211_003564 [Gyalolechia sp. 1 TL-2023]
MGKRKGKRGNTKRCVTAPRPKGVQHLDDGSKEPPSQKQDESPEQRWVKQLKSLSQRKSSPERMRPGNYWPPVENRLRHIFLFENGSKRYSVQITHSLLDHEEDGGPDFQFFTIRWNKEADQGTEPYLYDIQEDDRGDFVPVVVSLDTIGSRTFALKTDKESVLPCIFVALGWLMEEGKEEGKKQTTNVVVVLNISTHPMSLWLMFDYHMADFCEMPIRWTNQLGDYKNRLYRNFEPAGVSGCRDVFKQYDGPSPDKYQHCNTIRTGIPVMGCNGTSVQSADTPSDRTLVDNHKELPEDYTAKPSRDSALHDSAEDDQDSSWSAAATSSEITWLSPDPAKRGFFGIPEHDLVLLAPDIEAWATSGLDEGEVKLCIDKCHLLLGPTMRAQTATADQLEPIKDKWIDLQSLCAQGLPGCTS